MMDEAGRGRPLESRVAELEEAARQSDRFFAIIAHDLKSPMVTFLSAARILKRLPDLPADQREIVDTISNQAGRLQKLLDGLLDWASLHMTTGHTAEHLTVASLVVPIIEQLRPEIKSKAIRLACEIDETIAVRQDRIAMHTIISNLITNAIKFTDSGGEIGVEASRLNEGVCLVVRDTGVGMQQAEVDRLFRTGEKLQHRGTKGEPGSGLGLLIVSELLRQIDGSVDIESRIGEGSTFTVTVPDMSPGK